MIHLCSHHLFPATLAIFIPNWNKTKFQNIKGIAHEVVPYQHLPKPTDWRQPTPRRNAATGSFQVWAKYFTVFSPCLVLLSNLDSNFFSSLVKNKKTEKKGQKLLPSRDLSSSGGYIASLSCLNGSDKCQTENSCNKEIPLHPINKHFK